MRGFLAVVIFVGLGVLFIRQKQHDAQPTVTQAAPATAKASPAPKLTPAPVGVASEHNWMKRALDRATEVRDKSRSQSREAQDPKE